MAPTSKRKASSQDPETETPPLAIAAPLPGKLAADLLVSLQSDSDALCDVTLVGSDGAHVPAIRVLLAMRSKVFKTMLLGEFSERHADEVPTPYPSDVLKCVMEYCCTDKVAEFHELIHGEKSGDKDATATAKADATGAESLEKRLSILRTMVGTVAAADYFELRGLHSEVEDMLLGLLRSDNSGPKAGQDHKICDICFLWQTSMEHPSLDKLQSVALDHIISNTYGDLVAADGREDNPPGVMVLSPKSLLCLVKDDRLKVMATSLFDAVNLWSDAEGAARKR